MDDTKRADLKHIVLLRQTLNGSANSTKADHSKYSLLCRTNTHCLFHESVTSGSGSCPGASDQPDIVFNSLKKLSQKNKSLAFSFHDFYHTTGKLDAGEKNYKNTLYSGYAFLNTNAIFSYQFY